MRLKNLRYRGRRIIYKIFGNNIKSYYLWTYIKDMLMEKEIWKDVPGYEGLYKVSNLGRLYSVRKYSRGRVFGGHIMSLRFDKRNRCTIGLRKNGKIKNISFPRLVAQAFIENPNPLLYTEVNHLDENPKNNNVSNLEWCTHKYNCNYGTRIKRIKDKQNIGVLQYTLDGHFIAEYNSMHDAAQSIKADAGHICDCCLGNRSYAYGYFWRYKDNDKYTIAKKRLEQKIALGKKSRADKFREKALNVVQLDMDGNYIQTFQSTKIAAQSAKSHTPSIINCCNGKLKSAGGFKWMYERDYNNKDRYGNQR